MLDKLPFLALFYPVFLFSLACHEAAHAWMANRFGDPTARLLGRITINPLPHMDIIGTALLPIVAILTGVPLIGWGKPVPVNPYNLKDPRKDEIWIAALGPISNILLALLFAAVAWVMVLFDPLMRYVMIKSYIGFVTGGTIGPTFVHVLGRIIIECVWLNLVLAFFNMIPIYPLDGGGVLRGLLPERLVYKYDGLRLFGIILLVILIISGKLIYIFIPVLILLQILLPL